MCANATIYCFGFFNTGVALPYTALGVVLLLFIYCAIACATCFRHRHDNFTVRQDARQTPNGSAEAEAQEFCALTPEDFGGHHALDPSSQANFGVPGARGIDGESTNVQTEEDGYRCHTLLDQYVNVKQCLDGHDEPGWQLRSEPPPTSSSHHMEQH